MNNLLLFFRIWKPVFVPNSSTEMINKSTFGAGDWHDSWCREKKGN
jgi:hypothetical protein